MSSTRYWLAQGMVICFFLVDLVSAGVVAHYSFDEASGTSVADGSGNSNNGTLQVNGGTGALGAPGKFNNAVSLDGGSWVEATNATFSSITASDWSIAAWVTTNAAYNDSVVIGEFSGANGADPGSRWRPMNPYKDGGNVHAFSTFRNAASVGFPFGQDVVVSDVPNAIANDGTTWTHWAVTWDRASKILRSYINGTQVDVQTSGLASVDLMPFGPTLQIGRKGLSTNVSNFWSGKIDEIWVFDQVLDTTAITNLINVNSIPEPSSIILVGIVSSVLLLTRKRHKILVVREQA